MQKIRTLKTRFEVSNDGGNPSKDITKLSKVFNKKKKKRPITLPGDHSKERVILHNQQFQAMKFSGPYIHVLYLCLAQECNYPP